MIGLIKNLGELINPDKDQRLAHIHQGLNKCTKKMSSAAMYIDHFVHDMLDYSILSQGEESLDKTITKFDIRQSVNDIIEIQEDKFEMKNIDVQKKFTGFGQIYKICTDKMRF